MKRTFVTASVSILAILSTATVDSTAGSVALASSSYTPQAKSIYLNGNLVNKPYGIVANKTTYMPIWYVMQALNKLQIQNSWNGMTWTLTAPSTIPVRLSNPPTTHGSKAITLNGTTLYHVDSIAYADPASHVVTTFMPIWYVQQLLTRMNIKSTWDGRTWKLTTPLTTSGVSDPSHPGGSGSSGSGSSGSGSSTSPSTPSTANPGKRVITWANSAASLSDAQKQSGITEINNDNYYFGPDGTVNDGTPGASTVSTLVNDGRSHNVDVFMTVANSDPSTWNFSEPYTQKVLSDTTARATLEKNLTNMAVQNGYAGVDIDFESLKPTDRTLFTQFLTELSKQLHKNAKKLSVTLPAETSWSPTAWNGAYDYASIGSVADLVPIMTYDFSWPTSKPGAVAPLYWDDEVMKYATNVIPANKILMGLATYGYDWNTTTGEKASACSLAKIDAIIQQYKVSPSWDTADSIPYIRYTDASGQAHVVYYENQTSFQQKLSIVDKYGLSGICFWKAGLENQGFWNAIQPWRLAPGPQSHS